VIKQNEGRMFNSYKFQEKRSTGITVIAGPHHFNAEADPDPASHYDADPDPQHCTVQHLP
jgi:hypothetical protein